MKGPGDRRRGGQSPARLAPSCGRPRLRRLPGLLAGVALAASMVGGLQAAQEELTEVRPPDVEPPDLRQAERDLADARSELEGIVGPRLLRLAPPPLPEAEPPELAPEEEAFVARLSGSPPEEWDAGDRRRLEELLARAAPRLGAADEGAEAPEPEQLASPGLALLETSRLLSLRDRLALLRGDDETMVAGIEARLDLALRLSLQPAVLGSLLGHAIYGRVLEDVQAATLRPGTSTEALERLDAALFRWELEAPDAAAALAREALTSLERSEEEIESRQGAAAEPLSAVFSAPWIEAVAELARRCRADGCRRAVEAVERRGPTDDPYRVIANMMMPNLLDSVRKLTGGAELGRIARTAVALRLEARERGAYPPDLARLAPELGLSPEQEAELAYERLPGGGARLRLTSDRIVTEAAERNRDRYRRLVAWDLPPEPIRSR